MLETVARRLLRAVFGGGADISAANPLPVDTSPGIKITSAILTQPNIAATITTTLAMCAAIDLRAGYSTFALTVKARYFNIATQGIRIHVRTSPTNQAAGTHTAIFDALVMTDAAAHFIAGELVGLTINNVTSGHSAVITGNTELTVTVAAIVGGWSTNDVYTITGADYDTIDWDVWSPTFVADTVLRQTRHYDTDPMYIKVFVENLDPARIVSDVQVTAAVGA